MPINLEQILIKATAVLVVPGLLVASAITRYRSDGTVNQTWNPLKVASKFEAKPNQALVFLKNAAKVAVPVALGGAAVYAGYRILGATNNDVDMSVHEPLPKLTDETCYMDENGICHTSIPLPKLTGGTYSMDENGMCPASPDPLPKLTDGTYSMDENGMCPASPDRLPKLEDEICYMDENGMCHTELPPANETSILGKFINCVKENPIKTAVVVGIPLGYKFIVKPIYDSYIQNEGIN